MSVVVIGLNHRSAPVELREQFAFAESNIPDALKQLRESGLVAEGVVLSTCNRVEIYGATELPPDDAYFARVKRFLLAHRAYNGELGDELYTFAEPHSLHHLFKVAAGLDSMVIGETEIFGQLKEAYELALRHRHTGARLNKAFQRAFHVAKHIRTATNIQRGSVSVMSAAVELAERIFTSLAEHEVMVIGAGETSEKTARALKSRGVRKLAITNRSPESAASLATELGGRAVAFEHWPEELLNADIAISSTAAPRPILEAATLKPLLKRRAHRPLLLIDLAVPRDIDPAVNNLENVYLYNVDDLKAVADQYLKLRHEELDRCNQIIAEKVVSLLEANRDSTPDERLLTRLAATSPAVKPPHNQSRR